MERECEQGEMEPKLRRSFTGFTSRRAGPSTPPPTWRLEFSPPPPRVGETKEFLANPEVSVRKLCADLWETEQFRQRIGLRRCRRRDSDAESPSGRPLHDHQPPSRGSLRRQIVATDDHRVVRRNGHLLQPTSPASCSSSSSLEVVVPKPAFSQTGSSVVKSANYGLGSSTKLLKVLNRIWSLEEQNTANMSLVRALKMELDECRAEIKEVKQRENQSDRRGRKKMEEEEEEEVKDVFRSMKKDLDDERKFRKQSETLHRKLTRELCEAKHCLSKALKDLEKERQERVLVENLCDEFAKAVKDYEDKVRRIGNKSPVTDKVIVQIAEVWNDQRLQMKLEEDDKDVETYMRTRRDNKLQLKKSSSRLLNLSMSSEGDKIHPESSASNVDDHESRREKSRTFSKILQRNVNAAMREDNHRTLKDKLMEARVESRRLRSNFKSELSPSDPVQA
ncbi:PREDICTED: uncharacterized protein At5g41620-like isoform X2 [Camelina sativa]|uniref:Uncharacterized protein At5g41620-like isoform X1 n=1 Tax=Camelina sativa TaxID=90675 RepID=A0ABM0ZNL9_CAMSA|nr:PREDICTED: uncharacterized protein At5g41620-like isoform X1 [Camelina sativa]XP_010518295.1 PREDICTED: uncharacterized protein At5g41620-like isoform X2 [Camelina sativa]